MNKFILFVVTVIIGIFVLYVTFGTQGGIATEQIIQTTNEDGFVYKSDQRSFEYTPNNAAIEEGWTAKDDIMVLIKPENKMMHPFYIDAFEATISDFKAWSVPGQFPTDKLRYDDAHIACEQAGKRLCYIDEWQTACRGGASQAVTFNEPLELLKSCDFARSRGYDRNDYVQKTDSHIECTPSGYPLFHMLGNLSEFVQDKRGRVMVVGLTYYDGKMRNQENLIARGCERVISGAGFYPKERYNKGLGFRCCKDAK